MTQVFKQEYEVFPGLIEYLKDYMKCLKVEHFDESNEDVYAKLIRRGDDKTLINFYHNLDRNTLELSIIENDESNAKKLLEEQFNWISLVWELMGKPKLRNKKAEPQIASWDYPLGEINRD